MVHYGPSLSSKNTFDKQSKKMRKATIRTKNNLGNSRKTDLQTKSKKQSELRQKKLKLWAYLKLKNWILARVFPCAWVF